MGLAALSLASSIVVLEIPPAGRALQWLGANPAVAFALSACLLGLSAVRRRERIALETATSWLAALSAPSSTSLRQWSGAFARLLGILAVVALARALGKIAGPVALLLALAASAGALAGTAAGLRVRVGSGRSAPGWQYASVRRPRARWLTAPSLMPLAYWPVAQARFLGRPKITSLIVLCALLAMPAGARDVPGQLALAVAAGCMTGVTLLSLSAAALRIAGHAARWLAPTTIRRWAFTGALLWRATAKQAIVLAVVILLACALDYRQALRLGIPLAAIFIVASCAGACAVCLWSCRRVGLGASSCRR